ncbi:type II secretion system F family protein [Phenylobacterium sp.]|jgi:tight adherence protein C|uniref:type II secretion system F family protein n=1 Tax=Phenylobacterium sp. TaxID=1871053 RepID=UPI002E31D75D|nr:type II secretion system F family protein [Phenylobacterium sp.]HEX4712284.1 type II secretion system F family protein [Phenylobacterium sp.]
MDLQTLISAVGAVLVLGGVGGAAWMMASEFRLRSIRRGRMQTAGGPQTGPRTAARGPGGSIGDQLLGTVRRLGQQSAVRDPAKLSVLRSQLMQAGFYNREAPVIYLGLRAAALAVATLGVIVLLPLIAGGKGGMLGIAIAGVLAGGAIVGPDQVLKARRTTREREYSDGFPDLLDLLVASVEAGLSLDAAVTRVTEELGRRYPTLAVHLRFLVLELRAGKSRKDAWAAFADRLGIDDARQLATMLRQAEEMGTSLGETLTVFSQDMRSKRMLRAEEKALALSAKLTVPLILFIFPCLLGSLMLPAVARLMHVFAK